MYHAEEEAYGLSYLRGRESIERYLPKPPWVTLNLFEGLAEDTGKARSPRRHPGRVSVDGVGAARKAGMLKIAVRIFFGETPRPAASAAAAAWELVREAALGAKQARRLVSLTPSILPAPARRPPREVHVHLYVLGATGLRPSRSSFRKSSRDPYVRVHIGSKGFDQSVAGMDRGQAIRGTRNPRFFTRFDLRTVLPGPSRMHVSCLDRSDMRVGKDKVIGGIVIEWRIAGSIRMAEGHTEAP